MGKEEDNADPPIAALLGFHGHLSRAKVQDHVGWMGAVPRTPLRTLIARESSVSFRTIPDDPTPLLTKSSPARKTLAAAASGRRIGSCKVKGGSPSTTPPSGCSSPRSRMDQTSYKISAAAIPPKPMADFLRPVQLGTLFAQERMDQTRSSMLGDVAEPEPGSSFRSPSPGNRNPFSIGGCKATKVAPDVESSQELRYLFAKDWALQTSDEDDEFWDSGSLCGIASPSPRSGHDQRRRRTRKRNSKLRHSSSSHCSPLSAQPSSEPGIQHSRMNPPPFTTPPRIASRVQSPGRGYSCRLLPEDAPSGHISKSSLGTLLAEETAASSLAGVEPTWSVPVGSDSSRRPKIGSLSDISAPVRPESQSQLDFLIAKISTLRANSMEGKSSVTALAGEPDDGGCSTSGSIQAATAAEIMTVGEEEDLCGATDSSSSSSSSSSAAAAAVADSATGTNGTLSAPNVMNPLSPEIGEAPDSLPSTQEEPHSSVITSTVGATIESSITVADAVETALRHEVDDGDEPAEVMARSNNEIVAPAPERVQLGTLLEQTRGEHGWLPLGRSQMGSPLIVVKSQQPPASSSTSSQFNELSSDENCHHSSSRELVVPPRSSPGSPRSPGLVHHQQSADLPPESTTELASSTSPPAMVDAAAAEAATPLREQRPPTQRVSLLSLLNQDMEMELEDGLHSEVLCGGCRLNEEEEEPAEAEELDPMCCVCMVGHKGAAFIPCGHTFCRKCCREVRRSIGSCPLCNQAIVDVLKLY